MGSIPVIPDRERPSEVLTREMLNGEHRPTKPTVAGSIPASRTSSSSTRSLAIALVCQTESSLVRRPSECNSRLGLSIACGMVYAGRAGRPRRAARPEEGDMSPKHRLRCATCRSSIVVMQPFCNRFERGPTPLIGSCVLVIPNRFSVSHGTRLESLVIATYNATLAER